MDKIQKTSVKFIPYWVILNLLWSQDQIDPVQIRTQGVNHNKIAYVTRIDDPPTIDGILSEEAWNLATPINDFVQEFPNNLTLPSERTEVRLLFDDYALYVGVHLFDSSPKDISERLARRDDWMAGFEGKSDWFTIDLDSRHDHQTSFVFGINASGVQIDATVFDDFDYDEEWNAVWYSEISKDMTGWHIEIEIPFAILRYSESDTMTWGMDMARYIHRKNEHITWVPRPRGVRGIASRYGNLVGFDHVPAAKQIEFLPYFLTGRNKNTGENLTSPDFHPNEYTTIDQVSNKMEGGVDIKYGISSNAALDLTINPDFGWVEADPAVINLTYYESYFSEKRPFFMENSTLFETPIEMFYSRRIGKMDSRILTAGKLTGKSENGFSYGVLGAIESDNQGGSWSEGLVDDGLSYKLASRVVQDILMGNSFIGVMLTLSGKENYLASTISTDQLLTFDNNRLTLDQQIAMSDVNGLRGIGYSGELIYDNESFFSTYIAADYFDKKFNNNDLGYNHRNDLINLNTGFSVRKQEPGTILRYCYFSLDYGYQENLDGLNIGNYLNSEIGLTFHNYWRLFGGANRTFSYFDDKLTYDNETKKVGPASKLPRTDGLYLSFRTDHTKPFIIEGSISRARSVIGDWGRQFSFLLNIQPSSAIETSVYYSRNRSFERFHWLEITEEIINEDFPDSIDHHYMFAESNNRGNILTWRLSAGLSTDKSVEFYSEYFTNRNKFSDEQYLELIQECTYPDYTDYQPYSTDPDDSSLLDPNLYSPLFAKYSSLNLNFVFRWEYSPGSTLYFIYTIAKSINGKESDRISDFWNYNGGEDWTEFLNESSVYVKINYRFNR